MYIPSPLGRTLGLAALLTGAASAQTFTQLIAQGDVVPGSAPSELVNRIDQVDINNNGDWGVMLDGDGATTGDAYALVNGAIVFQEGTNTGLPSPGTRLTTSVEMLDLNDAGDHLFLVHTIDPALAACDQESISVIRNGVEIYQAGVTTCAAPGPAVGLVYTDLEFCWQNNNDQLLLGARVGLFNDQILVKVDLDATLGTVLSETMIALEKETLLSHATPIQGFSFAKGHNAINDTGSVLWFVDDEHLSPGGDVVADSNFYIDSTLLYNEADAFPPAPLESFDSLARAQVAFNDSGDFVFSGFDRRPETNDAWIYQSIGGVITVLAHEDDPVPASVPGAWVAKGLGFGGLVSMGDNGDVLWFLDWNDPDTTKDTGWLLNDHLILQEGVTVLDSLVVASIPTSDSHIALSDDGLKAIARVQLTGGIDAAYLIENMEPSPFATFCDPAAPNSTSQSTQLTGYFLTMGGISGGMSDLHLECSDGPPNQLGYFLTCAVATDPGTAISDGFFCLIGGGSPFYRYTVSGTTSISIGFFNAAGAMENVVGTSSSGPVGFETGFDVPDAVSGTSQLITTGSTWHFQAWHRDTTLGSSHSNFSNGLSVAF